ncbi:MAG: FlgN protein [Paenibacillus sp.]|jgi:hypothetical protein|nr:FlgN protein [Paenibacillus sp.]
METVIRAMDEMIDVHQLLIELGTEKKSVIVDNQVDRLSQITQKENKLIKLAADLEALRIQAVNAYLRGRGLFPAGAVSVSDLSKLVVKLEEKEALLSRQRSLISLIHELKSIHEVNQQLIAHSLAYIDYSLDLLSASPDQEPTYQHPLNDHTQIQRNRMFDRKA